MSEASGDMYRWLTDSDPVMANVVPPGVPYTYKDLAAMAMDFSDVENRVRRAMFDKQQRVQEMMYERNGLGYWVPEGSATGRFTINQPNPQPRPTWQFKLPPCPCGMCPDPPDEVTTPFHPSALRYKAQVQIAARRAADEAWYAQQDEREARRREEQEKFNQENRVKFRGQPRPGRILW